MHLRHYLRPLLAALSLLASLAPVARAAEPVRIVATGGRIGYTFYAHPGGSTCFRQRSPHVLGGPVAEIQIGFMDWMYPTSSAETPNDTNDVTITHAWLERASTGQVVPLTFSGSRQLVLPMNSTTPVWLSDPVPASAWTGASLARDEIFWVNARGTIPEGGKVPVGTPTSYSGARYAAYAPANETGAYDTAGPVATIAGWTTRIEGIPLIFLGRYTGPGHLAVIGVGDSILHGSGDGANPTATIAGYGFFNRAALDANGKNTIATFNLTRHGQTASSWVAPTRQTRQAPFLAYANVMVEEYGTNDLGSGGTGTPSTIQTNLEKIWTAARSAGVQKIVRTRLMPRTTSPTDLWATLAGQTPNTGWETGGKRDAINTGLATALAAGKIDVLVDSLAVLGDPADDSRWITTGAQKYATADGTHLTAAANALLAPRLRAALLALTIDEGRTDYARWSSAINWGGSAAAPEADADGDGISNLLAYAFDRSPLLPIPASSLPSETIDNMPPGGPWIALEYLERTDAADLTYEVETSANLNDWGPLAINGIDAVAEWIDTPTDSSQVAMRRIRVRLDPAAPRLFLRLRVTRS